MNELNQKVVFVPILLPAKQKTISKLVQPLTLSKRILTNIYPFLLLLQSYLSTKDKGFEGSIDVAILYSYSLEYYHTNTLPVNYISQIRYRLRQLYKAKILINRNQAKFHPQCQRSETRKYYGINYTLLNDYIFQAQHFVEGSMALKHQKSLKQENISYFVKARKVDFDSSPNIYITTVKIDKDELLQNKLSQVGESAGTARREAALNGNRLEYLSRQQKLDQNAENILVPQAKNLNKIHKTIGVKWVFIGFGGKVVQRESYSIKGFYEWCLIAGAIKDLPYQSYDYFKKQLKSEPHGILSDIIEYKVGE